MDRLDDDTVQEILSRLPIRSLMKCHLVCRRLLVLTHGFHFTRIHTARSLTAKPGIILSDHFSIDGSLSIHSEFFFMDRRITAPIPAYYPVRLSIPYITEFKLLSSCNGLLFLSSYNHNPIMFVCNPFIRNFILIPYHQYPIGQLVYNIIDFGFCPKTESYKVLEISIWRISGGINAKHKMKIYVHKLGDNSWKRVKTQVYIITRRFDLAANIHGAFHWVDGCYGALLTVFDLEHDKFFKMAGPLPGRGKFATAIIENCLSIINYYDNIVDVWIMKEYWISWEKFFVINLNTLVLVRSPPFKILNYEVEGREFLILQNPNVLTYNVEEDVFMSILSLEGWQRVLLHYDTLVSPFGLRTYEM